MWGQLAGNAQHSAVSSQHSFSVTGVLTTLWENAGNEHPVMCANDAVGNYVCLEDSK